MLEQERERLRPAREPRTADPRRSVSVRAFAPLALRWAQFAMGVGPHRQCRKDFQCAD